jgi:hypothetical protein
MKTVWIAFLALAFAAIAMGGAAAEDKDKKSKPAPKSDQRADKNVFQKAESSVGDWANRNKIWITRKKKAEKKKD